MRSGLFFLLQLLFLRTKAFKINRKRTVLYLNFSAHLIVSEMKYQCYKLSFGLFCFFSCGGVQNKAVKCDLEYMDCRSWFFMLP